MELPSQRQNSRRFRCAKRPFAAGLVFIFVCGCASDGIPLQEIAPEINRTYVSAPDLLVVGDQLEVRFAQLTQYDHSVRIGPNGKASFLIVDEQPAAGITIAELDKRLSALYSKLEGLQNPQLTISVSEPAARVVHVIGEVREPGPVPYGAGGMTLIDAIAGVGGYRKESADLEEVRLVRWLASEKRMAVWSIDASEDFWEGPERVYLLPGDLVMVPNTTIDDVNIWMDKYIRQMLPIAPPVPAITP
ncbi:MAG: SLBB domain-containing protein [Planctomycetes bacterium]|nr:SLBB domain-containing protein [Planctomycetota bacterium]